MDQDPSNPAYEEGERTAIVPTLRSPGAGSRDDWVHYLVAVDGAQQGRRARLGLQPTRLGRRAPCEWLLTGAEVSGLHCAVCVPEGAHVAEVIDLGSTNGTYIEGRRVTGSQRLNVGQVLQVGLHAFKHEYRPQHEIERSEELGRELEQASRYILSLLPPPMRTGPVRTEWVFEPSANLGGDAFGYFALDENRFAGYLLDVSGHGIAAAVHTVSVLNVLRQQALPGVDFADPAQVMARLNAMFPMEAHGGLYFTLWYGVYDRRLQRLDYGSAGHHPAYLVSPDRSRSLPLKTRNPMIGALPEARFSAASMTVTPGSTLYVFSDGVFEIATAQGRLWGLGDFAPLLLQAPLPGQTEPERLRQAVRLAARPGPLEDDFSLLAVTLLT